MIYQLKYFPHKTKTIDIPDDHVTILIGKNGSGKSKILLSIKNAPSSTDSILLTGSYESIPDIQTVNISGSETEQTKNYTPLYTPSLVAANPELLKIFQFYFKTLFNLDIKVENNAIKTGDFKLNDDADGLKSIFNLTYYILSQHKTLLLDEPERFFHPSLSELFLTLLSEVAKNYKKKIVITTHSQELMRFDLSNVVIYRVNNDPSSIFNLQTWINDISVPEYTDTKSKQAFKDWFFFHSDVVFAKYAILVEGFSDQITLNSLKQKLSFEYRLEDLVIKSVASSHHEAGGKTRMHKMQTFLNTLLPTYSLADKDIIGTLLTNWYAWSNTDPEPKVIGDAKLAKLFILSKAELEDYYFIDPSYDYCQSIAQAKANKIAASYEQARIILTKPYKEIETQYSEIVNFFKIIINYSDSIDSPLKQLAKDYVIDKHLKGENKSTHLRERVDGSKIKVGFNFTPSSKEFEISIASLEKIKRASDEIDTQLNT